MIRLQEIKKLDVLSVAKINSIFGLLFGLIVGVITLSPLALLVFAAIGFVWGFVVGDYLSWLYNIISGTIGRITLEIKHGEEHKSVVTAIEPTPLAKIAACLGLINGIVYGIIATVILSIMGNQQFATILSSTAVSRSYINTWQHAPLGILVFEPLVGLFVGLIGAWISAYLYNWLSAKYGGIKILLSQTGAFRELKKIDIFSYAKMLTMVSLFFYIILGIFLSLVFGTQGIGVAAILLLLVVVLGVVFSFIFGVIFSAVYNAMAGSRIGGIRLKLE